MHILVIGGSGDVGSLILPHLAQQHTLRVFDLRPPVDPAWDYVAGNVGDFDALRRAADGVDALLYMAMGHKEYPTTSAITTNFDVNVKGVYLALDAAQRAGATHAVYTSSMSVYGERLTERYFPDEEITPDASGLYGFTKRLGEEVCRNATREWGMSVNALRLCFPVADDAWQDIAQHGTPVLATAASDVARLVLAALAWRGNGFNAFMASGDYEQQVMNMAKARRMLDWEPLARPGA